MVPSEKQSGSAAGTVTLFRNLPERQGRPFVPKGVNKTAHPSHVPYRSAALSVDQIIPHNQRSWNPAFCFRSSSVRKLFPKRADLRFRHAESARKKRQAKRRKKAVLQPSFSWFTCRVSNLIPSFRIFRQRQKKPCSAEQGHTGAIRGISGPDRFFLES